MLLCFHREIKPNFVVIARAISKANKFASFAFYKQGAKYY